MSMTDMDLDDMPIFMTRLVAETGGIMKGGAAHVGSDGVDALDALLDELARMHQIGVGLEDQLDLRELRDGIRAQDVDGREAGQRLLERNGHERLDVAGGQAEGGGLDLDARRRELREDVDGRGAQLLHPEEHRPRRDRDDDEPVAQAGRDDPAKHGQAPTVRLLRVADAELGAV